MQFPQSTQHFLSCNFVLFRAIGSGLFRMIRVDDRTILLWVIFIRPHAHAMPDLGRGLLVLLPVAKLKYVLAISNGQSI
jgi:hypothetical protein